MFIKLNMITGSKAFFSGLENFKPKDTDYLYLVNYNGGFKYYRQSKTNNGDCLFEFIRRDKYELIDYALNSKGPAMQVIKFLTPEFAKEIKLEIADLKLLKPLIDNLDEKHKYAQVIYESYIENNDFTLTDKQRNKAFELYKESRKEDKNYESIRTKIIKRK